MGQNFIPQVCRRLYAVRRTKRLCPPGPQPQREQEQGGGFKAQDAGAESSGCEVVAQEQSGFVFGQAAFGADHGDAARRVDQLGGLDEFHFFLFPAK